MQPKTVFTITSVYIIYLLSVGTALANTISASPEASAISLGTTTLLVSASEAVQKERGAESGERVLFSFDSPDDPVAWRSVNDTVMGGISGSTFQITGEGSALFSGELSLDNNGGFASVQSSPSAYDLSEFEGIALRVKGDGKRYKISLRNSAYFASPRYQAVFTAKQGGWDIMRIPFSTLVPTMHGDILYNKPPLDSSKVVSFVLLISDKQEGRFKLEIDWIKAYRTQ